MLESQMIQHVPFNHSTENICTVREKEDQILETKKWIREGLSVKDSHDMKQLLCEILVEYWF